MKTLSLILLTVISVSACSKQNSENDKNSSKVKYKPKEDTYTPLVDPSICENNPEGFIYFKFGDETFRFTKESPIQMVVREDGTIYDTPELIKQKTEVNEIPMGCEGNPYRGGIQIQYVYKEGDENYKKLDMGLVMHPVPPEYLNKLSVAEKTSASRFDYFKRNGVCNWITPELEKCGASSTIDKKYDVAYKSTKFLLNDYFTMDCDGYMKQCRVYSRLYNSISLSYIFDVKNNKYYEELEVLNFDKHIRSSIESIRLK